VVSRLSEVRLFDGVDSSAARNHRGAGLLHGPAQVRAALVEQFPVFLGIAKLTLVEEPLKLFALAGLAVLVLPGEYSPAGACLIGLLWLRISRRCR